VGGSSPTDGNAGAGGTSSSDGGAGIGGSAAGGTSAGGSPSLSCWQNDAAFPSLDKSCTTDSDCFVALHVINCCGTQTAIGLNVSAQVSFNAAESVCPPACTCVSEPTTAEDGNAVSSDHPTIAVMCTQGLCETYIP
jgi:hypothetical protein